MTKDTKNNSISNLLVNALAVYVFITSLIIVLKRDNLIFWPLFLLIVVMIFVTYVLYKNHKGKAAKSLVIGITVEAILSTIVISHRLIGSLGDMLNMHCNGLFGTTTKCSESISFSIVGLGSILALPMLIVAITSFVLSKRTK